MNGSFSLSSDSPKASPTRRSLGCRGPLHEANASAIYRPTQDHELEQQGIQDQVVDPTSNKLKPLALFAIGLVINILGDSIPMLASVDAPNKLGTCPAISCVPVEVLKSVYIPCILSTFQARKLLDFGPGLFHHSLKVLVIGLRRVWLH